MGISCAGCGYDNDPTRVYCHNCGVKLERGTAVAPPPTGFTHPTDVAKVKPRRAPINWRGIFGAFLKACVLVALAAVLVLAVLPPREVPPPVAADARTAERVSGLVRNASASDAPRGFALPAGDVQRWLATVVQLPRPDAAWKLDPQRVYFSQRNDLVRVGVEASLFNVLDLFFEGDYRPVLVGKSYTLQPQSYSVGRLPLPVVLGWPVERQMSALAEALAGPLSQLARASYIGVAPDEVTLRWSGTPAR